LVTYYVLFFIHLGSRRVAIAGITVHPNEAWMKHMARNATREDCGALGDCRYLLHDRDTQSPNLNACAERWVRSDKEECLSRVILFGERSLRRALREYVGHFHVERHAWSPSRGWPTSNRNRWPDCSGIRIQGIETTSA